MPPGETGAPFEAVPEYAADLPAVPWTSPTKPGPPPKLLGDAPMPPGETGALVERLAGEAAHSHGWGGAFSLVGCAKAGADASAVLSAAAANTNVMLGRMVVPSLLL